MSTRDVTYNGETIEAVMVGSYTLEMHYDPPMKVSEIRAGAEDINMLERRLLGRAEGMNEDFDGAAKEFTDIVKWDISTVSAEDLATWMEVASSLRFCAGVTEEWADHVSEYKQARRRIIDRWNDEAPAHEADLEDTEAVFQFIGQKTPAEKAGEALSALKEELEVEEATAYGELDSRSTEIMNDLKNGPTPEAVQRLIENGYVTWSYFNLGGDVEAMPIDADPDELADELVEYIANPDKYGNESPEIIALLNNIGLVAFDRQNNGGTLSSEELKFLTDFYDALEDAGGDGKTDPGVLGIVNDITENTHLEGDEKNNILGALGNGLLTLSDESLLGSYERLPDSIKNATEGPKDEGEPNAVDWAYQTEEMAKLFENSIPELRGGQQFSVNLTQSIAHALDIQNTDPSDPSDTPGNHMFFENQHETLLELSTRNESANHAILTGEGTYEHPTHGLDTELTLRGIFTNEWEPDSDAVTGLTDWITEYSQGNEGERLQAAEAAAGLISALGSKGENETNIFLETGKIVEGNGNAAITEINPGLAESLGNVFFEYIDSFGTSYDSAETDAMILVGDDAWNAEDLPMHETGDALLRIDMETRQEFLQILLANEDLSPNILTATIDHEHRSMHETIFSQDYPPKIYSDEAARLRDLTEAAMSDEIESRLPANNAALEQARKEASLKWEIAYKTFAELSSGGLGAVPVAGDALGTGSGVLGVLMEEPMKSHIGERAEEEISTLKDQLGAANQDTGYILGDDTKVEWHVHIQVANMLINEGMIDIEDFENTTVLTREDDGIQRFPQSILDWEDGHANKSNQILEVIMENSQDQRMPEIIEEYISSYQNTYEARNN